MTKDRLLQLPFDTYLEGVHGAWLGKFIGGTVGARFEGHKILGAETPDTLWPEKIVPNDDLDIQVVWLEMLEENGPWFTHGDLVRYWQDRCSYNFSEYGFFLHNVERGIHPPLSGRFNNTFFCESMGCPIRAEIWGCVAPGNPELAAALARIDGELDHIGESICAEQFWAAAMAVAIVSKSRAVAIEAGRSVLPPQSILHCVIDEVTGAYAEHEDWREIWRFLVRAYGHRDCSKAVLNFAFTFLSVIACEDDFKLAVTSAVNCGWDVDCTAATAGALLGAVRGGSQLPGDWCERIGKNLNCALEVRHKTAPIAQFALDTCKAGLEMAWSRNHAVEILHSSDAVTEEIRARQARRSPPGSITLAVEYEGEPTLLSTSEARARLVLKNDGDDTVRGLLQLTPPDGVLVSPECAQLSVRPHSSQYLTFSACRADESSPMRDRNLVTASWRANDGVALEHVFGFTGARQWIVYGPYWDIYDTERSDHCPYRHEGFACHPGQTENGIFSCFHNHVRLDRAYLDEARLLIEGLPEESPLLLERGESTVDAAHIGNFTGEAVYYLVREIVAPGPMSARLVMGSTAPMIVWIDGVESIRSESVSSWFPLDHFCPVAWNGTPRRIVVKLACPADSWRISMSFLRRGAPNQGKRGVSYLEDRLGDRVVSSTLACAPKAWQSKRSRRGSEG